MPRLTILLFGMLFLLIPKNSFSTHIVGGEINYKYLSGDSFELTLVVYRDCFNGIPFFDNPACISVFDKTGKRYKDLSLSFSSFSYDTVPLRVSDTCTFLDSTICYQIGTYKSTYLFPPVDGGYTLLYDRCCWNMDVVNMKNPLENGVTLSAHIADSIYMPNSNPVFKNRTPPFVCHNQLFEFDHSAIDADGDSLVYDLFTPLNASYGWQEQSWQCPKRAAADTLFYAPGFGIKNVLGNSSIPLNIDPLTGFMTAIPSRLGQFVFGVRVKEYRNGLLIGETTRSYQLNVKSCQRVTYGAFKDVVQCADTVAIFKNNSVNYTGALWNFGNPLAGSDSISNEIDPTHHYHQPGKYNVTMVAYSIFGDVCNDTTIGTVTIYPDLEANFEWEDRLCDNFVQFTDLTSDTSGKISEWIWNFGDGSTSKTQNPFHNFDLNEIPKDYEVTLSVKNINDCSDTVLIIYTGVNSLYKIESVSTTKDLIYPRYDSTLISVVAENASTYVWSPKASLSSPNSASTWASPSETTIYTVIVTDDRGCQDQEKITVQVFKYSCGETEVYVPNAFSPNGDGENDFLRIRGEEIRSLRLSVYNRWGEMVYESENVGMIDIESYGWDGRYKGVLQDPGVYVYHLKVTCESDFEFSKTGNITLIR